MPCPDSCPSREQNLQCIQRMNEPSILQNPVYFWSPLCPCPFIRVTHLFLDTDFGISDLPGFDLWVSSSLYTKESHKIISTLSPFEKNRVSIWLQRPWLPASPPFPTYCAQDSDLGFSCVHSTMVDNRTRECTLGGSLEFKLWLAHLPIALLMCHKVFMDLSLLTSKLGP